MSLAIVLTGLALFGIVWMLRIFVAIRGHKRMFYLIKDAVDVIRSDVAELKKDLTIPLKVENGQEDAKADPQACQKSGDAPKESGKGDN